MKTATNALVLVLALVLELDRALTAQDGGAPPPAAPAAEPADVRLPFNPAEGAAPGDWAQYRVVDPAAPPSERLPAERFTVREVAGGVVTAADSSGKIFKYKLGEDGASAKAFLQGFFGESYAAQLRNLRSIAVVPDGAEVGGKRYEGVRVDAVVVTRVTAEQGGGRAGDMKATFRVWLSPGVKVGGFVRAEASAEFEGAVHRGVLDLEAHGAVGDAPPRPAGPQAPTRTAEPEPKR